jgi:hypothetical protein
MLVQRIRGRLNPAWSSHFLQFAGQRLFGNCQTIWRNSGPVAEAMVTKGINSGGCTLGGVFCNELDKLHLLACILTGSSSSADECILDAFESVHNSFLASPDFAYDTAKLATIKLSLRRVANEIKDHAFDDSARHNPGQNGVEVRALKLESGGCEQFLAAILKLNAFHRAVLLLRVYERYRAHVAAVLLRLPSSIVERGKVHALVSLVTQIPYQRGCGAERSIAPELIMLHSRDGGPAHGSYLQSYLQLGAGRQ